MDYTSTYPDYATPGPMFAFYNSPFFWIVYIVVVIGFWKIFEKAGHDGWKAIIPIYNLYILLQIIGKPTWWLILYFIPFVNIVIAIIVAIRLAKVFGKDAIFGFFLNFLIPIGPIILGFGSSKYKKSKS